LRNFVTICQNVYGFTFVSFFSLVRRSERLAEEWKC